MFLSDNTPILYNTSFETEQVQLYMIHDTHYGNEQFDEKKYNAVKNEIMDNPDALVVWVGDLMENAIPNSKSDMFSQTATPFEQREWVAKQFIDLASKTVAIVAGNHESNRSTKAAGLYPLYDAALIAGISDKYRDTFAFVDIGVGRTKKDPRRQQHYVGQIQHRAKDIKSCSSADYTDGIDFFIYGHDHEAKDKPRAKLHYDTTRKIVSVRSVEVLNCGSFLTYGGYGARAAYRPQSDKMYSLTLFGGERKMETRGFYV